MSRLVTDIHAALVKTSDRWYGGLAATLAGAGWSRLSTCALTQRSYGTARVLRSNGQGPRLGTHLDDAGWRRPILIERFDDTMRERYGRLDLRERRLPPTDDALRSAFVSAMRLIDMTPGASDAVRRLVWSISVLAVDDPDYDVSHSDPAVPFSIFVGVHERVYELSAIRLAEGILHEAMHLQLSLIEAEVRLVVGSEHMARSPWQDKSRPTQGLLHGLYVFRVIQDWLVAVHASGLDGAERIHAERRIEQIDSECRGLVGLTRSGDLTPAGRSLALALAARA